MSKELFEAIKARDKDKVEHLVKQNPSIVNAKNKFGQTPLYLASWFADDNTAIIECLIEKGAEVNKIVGPLGQTPLHMAVIVEGIENVRALVKANADTNIRDVNGQTPHDLVMIAIRGLVYINPAEQDASINRKQAILDLLKDGYQHKVKRARSSKSESPTVPVRQHPPSSSSSSASFSASIVTNSPVFNSSSSSVSDSLEQTVTPSPAASTPPSSPKG